MRNFKLKLVLSFFVISASVINYIYTNSKNGISELVNSNIEALAYAEGTGGGGGVEVVCSYTCRDGIGKCWFRFGGSCVRSSSPQIYCSCN